MNLEKLEQNVQKLADVLDEKSFIYDLLLAYDFPKATITRLKNGDRNQSKKTGEIIWKKICALRIKRTVICLLVSML